MIYLALDIGGTHIKYGLVDKEGTVICSYTRDTEAYKGADHLLNNIKEIIKFLLCECEKQNKSVKAIGISTAGQVNSKTGEIIFATDAIPGWTGVQLKNIVEQEFNYPCSVENDVNCAALGEMWVGAAKGIRNFLCLTLGTGVGGAIVIDGKILTGNNYSAGEFGHINLYPEGIECNCGHRGCFERYASTSALVNMGKEILASNGVGSEEIDKLNGKIIFERVKAGDKLCIALLNKWTYHIALGLKSLIHIFNPSLIVIGGGVSAQKEFLTDRIKHHLEEMIMPSFAKTMSIKTAECGNHAGMLGAVSTLKDLDR